MFITYFQLIKKNEVEDYLNKKIVLKVFTITRLLYCRWNIFCNFTTSPLSDSNRDRQKNGQVINTNMFVHINIYVYK